MSSNTVLWPALGVLFCVTTLLGLSKTTRQDLLGRFSLHHAATSRPTTPNVEKQPLSTSSAGTPKSAVTPSPSAIATLRTTFPTSPREQLIQLSSRLPAGQQAALGDPASSFDEETFQQSLLQIDEDYRAADESKYSYSGLSVREIKALGDFPDYAALSEVPLPQPYPEFDIDTARPRPYRPFRWGYHQTMCTLRPLLTTCQFIYSSEQGLSALLLSPSLVPHE